MKNFSICLYFLGVGVIACIQAYIPLTRDATKDQIFVQGNWYNKDGSTNTPFDITTPHAFFTQCMHHENASGCDQTWQQRYWVNTEYYQPGGAVFIEIAGEWDAAGDINGGYWYNYAMDHNAMLIVLEHRFYGGSFPVQNPHVSDLWLMTSQQALADAARFIEVYKEQNDLQGAGWVAFGCSYGANLAAWFKLKYPFHVKTAVSSSGPVEAIYDFPGYMQTVSQVIEDTDDFCSGKLRNTFTCMEALANGSASSCLTYTDPADLTDPLRYCYFVDWDGLSREQMFNYLGMNAWADNAPLAQVRQSCALLHSASGADDIIRYGNFMVASGNSGGCRKSKQSKSQSVQMIELELE